jgi:hypothetical protein
MFRSYKFIIRQHIYEEFYPLHTTRISYFRMSLLLLYEKKATEFLLDTSMQEDAEK